MNHMHDHRLPAAMATHPAFSRRDWLQRAGGAVLLLSGAVPAAADDAAPAALPKDSVYQLTVDLVDQDGRSAPWAAHRGRPVVVAMFYTSCQAVCPMIIEAMRANHARLSTAARERVDLLLVSFDPANDTPAVLKRAASQRELDANWTLATGTPAVVRQLAAVLGVQYKARPDGEFNHSSVLFLLDRDGRVAAKTTRLGGADPAFVGRMQQLAG